MQTSAYALQLAPLYNVGDLTKSYPVLQHLIDWIDAGLADTLLLKNAAAMVHADCAAKEVMKNVYAMREELRGELAPYGIKDYMVGIRAPNQAGRVRHSQYKARTLQGAMANLY